MIRPDEHPPDRLPVHEIGGVAVVVGADIGSRGPGYWPCIFPGCELGDGGGGTELCVTLSDGRVRGLCERHRDQIEGLIERGVVNWR